MVVEHSKDGGQVRVSSGCGSVEECSHSVGVRNACVFVVLWLVAYVCCAC